jgi:threonyl-tRNA synthetase
MKHTITTTHDHTTGRDLFVVLTPDGFDAYGEGFNTEAEAQKRAKELDEYAEHFGGDFPAGLAPEQVRLVPISDKLNDYARAFLTRLKAEGVRATIDEHTDKLGGKIRRAELDKVPYTLVMGYKEAETQSVSVRSRARGDEGVISLDVFVAKLKAEVATRALPDKKKV